MKRRTTSRRDIAKRAARRARIETALLVAAGALAGIACAAVLVIGMVDMASASEATFNLVVSVDGNAFIEDANLSASDCAAAVSAWLVDSKVAAVACERQR